MTLLERDLGLVRELSSAYISGKPEAIDAARDLIALLLHSTVAKKDAPIRLTKLVGEANKAVLGAGLPIPLNDGRYLRMLVSFSLDAIPGQPSKLRVYQASYQYQHDLDEKRWIFRYDYDRAPRNHHPPSHLQVNAHLKHHCSGMVHEFPRTHLPTGRVTVEAVVRLLAEQFRVRCNRGQKHWRQVLALSEGAFEKIAHRPISGPSK